MADFFKGILVLALIGIAVGVIAVIGYFAFHIILFFLPVLAIAAIGFFLIYGIYCAVCEKK